jgi:hypothetical protein
VDLEPKLPIIIGVKVALGTLDLTIWRENLLEFLRYRCTINIVVCHTKFGGQTKGIVKERISLYLESL